MAAMNNLSHDQLEPIIKKEYVHAAPNSQAIRQDRPPQACNTYVPLSQHASRQDMTLEDVHVIWDSQAQEVPESQITEGSESEPDDVIDLTMTDEEEEEEEEEEDSDMASFIVSDDEPVLETQDSYKPSQTTASQTSEEEDTDDEHHEGSQPVTKGHYHRCPRKKEVVVLVTPVKTRKCNKRKNL